MNISSTPNLYRLRILEEDANGIVIDGIVKVRYIRYGKDFDERRKQENNVNLECNDSSAENAAILCQVELPTVSKFCLYKELTFRVKSVLYSTRKADPLCSVVVSLIQYTLKD